MAEKGKWSLVQVGGAQCDEACRETLAVGDFAAGDVYLVDPLGNLMMHFPKQTGMQGMQEDLKRLLRVSRIG